MLSAKLQAIYAAVCLSPEEAVWLFLLSIRSIQETERMSFDCEEAVVVPTDTEF